MAETKVELLGTILVVDDYEAVLSLVTSVLERARFLVLPAKSGSAAIELAAKFEGKIDLLLSDVKMRLMSGPDLAEALLKVRPGLHVMFMSGFPGGELVLNYGWAFIEKPFIPQKLVEMIQVVLNTPNKSQGSRNYDTRQGPRGPLGE